MKSHWDREGDFERVVGRGKDEDYYIGHQDGFNCSSLSAGLGENVKFERKFEEIWGNLRGNNSE